MVFIPHFSSSEQGWRQLKDLFPPPSTSKPWRRLPMRTRRVPRGHSHRRKTPFCPAPRALRTFQEPDGRLRREGEGVEGAGDLQQPAEVLSHVVAADGADVVDGFGRHRGQPPVAEPFHQITQHGICGGERRGEEEEEVRGAGRGAGLGGGTHPRTGGFCPPPRSSRPPARCWCSGRRCAPSRGGEPPPPAPPPASGCSPCGEKAAELSPEAPAPQPGWFYRARSTPTSGHAGGERAARP